MRTNAGFGHGLHRLTRRIGASPPPDLFALFFFLALILVAGQPVLRHLDTVIAGNDVDVYLNPWADWWTLKALRDPIISLWRSDYLFYPGGADLTYHSFSHLNTALSLLLRPLLGALPAYNMTILVNYLLIALSMYQFARYWTGSATAGLVAGVVFAFNSHALYQSAHPALLSIWTLPWTALFLLKAMDEDSMKAAVVAIVPTGRQVDKSHAYYQTIHDHKMVNGVVSRASAGTQDFIRGNALLRAGMLGGTPVPPPADTGPALRKLERAGVDLLIVEKGWSDVDVEAWRAVLPGAPVYEDVRLLVYAIEERAQLIGDHP